MCVCELRMVYCAENEFRKSALRNIQGCFMYIGYLLMVKSTYALYVNRSQNSQIIYNQIIMLLEVHIPFQISVFVFFGQIPRSAITGLYGSAICNFLRKLHFDCDF